VSTPATEEPPRRQTRSSARLASKR
jgi:hypothetical protein